METVINWVKVNKIVYWRIVDKQTGNVVARYDEETANEEQALDLLNQNLSFLKDGKYSIFGRKSLKATNSEMEFPFTIGKETGVSGYGGNTEIGYIMQIEDLKRQLDKKDMMHKMEIMEVKRKMDDGKPDFLDRFTKVIELMEKTNGDKTVVTKDIAGTTDNPQQEELAQNLDAIAKGIGQEELVTLTKKLAQWVKLSPEAVKDQLKKNGLL